MKRQRAPPHPPPHHDPTIPLEVAVATAPVPPFASPYYPGVVPQVVAMQHAAAHAALTRRGSAAAAPPASAPRRRHRDDIVRQPRHTSDELSFAKRTLRKLVQDSRFFPVRDDDNRVGTLGEDAVDVGRVLGRGGFCEVRSARVRTRSSSSSSGSSPREQRYAMKYLSPTKTRDSRVFQRGIADLAMEACFLSLLSHEHVIGLHYVSEGSLEENYGAHKSSRRHGHGHGHGGRDDHRRGRQEAPPDEIVMDAHGNLQLRRRTPSPVDHRHVFGYFLLLDPLYETLADRIDNTYIPQALAAGRSGHGDRRRHHGHGHGHHHHISHPYDPADPRARLASRLGALKCVASALQYLHDRCHILFRDIKPDNIGFYRRPRRRCTCGYRERDGGHRDERGRRASQEGARPAECTCYDDILKLFDFGLAKELKPKYCVSHPAYPGTIAYRLTGCTGSRRYMAPEVCFSEPYNESADTYSFGILAYQVASLCVPFDGYSAAKHEREVLQEGRRPDLSLPPSEDVMAEECSAIVSYKEEDAKDDDRRLAEVTKRHWPKELPHLIEECWDPDMRYRPEMREVTTRLERCIDDLLLQLNSRKAGGGAVHKSLRKQFNPLTLGESHATLETAPMSSAHPTSHYDQAGRTGGPPRPTPQDPHGQVVTRGVVTGGNRAGRSHATNVPPSRGAERDAREPQRRRSSTTQQRRGGGDPTEWR